MWTEKSSYHIFIYIRLEGIIQDALGIKIKPNLILNRRSIYLRSNWRRMSKNPLYRLHITATFQYQTTGRMA